MYVVKRITLQLDVGKTVELSGFNVSGSNTVCMTVQFVELELSIYYCIDFLAFTQWKTQNPTGTWRDWAKTVLAPIFDAYALAKQMKMVLESEAT